MECTRVEYYQCVEIMGALYLRFAHSSPIFTDYPRCMRLLKYDTHYVSIIKVKYIVQSLSNTYFSGIRSWVNTKPHATQISVFDWALPHLLATELLQFCDDPLHPRMWPSVRNC